MMRVTLRAIVAGNHRVDEVRLIQLTTKNAKITKDFFE
jgi:hypothetical protein